MKRIYLIVLGIAFLLLCSCAQPPAEVPTPETLPPAETITPPPTPPSVITGLVACDAYDGRVNLWWDKSAAEDFDHYNVYVSKAKMDDITGVTAICQIKDIASSIYQVTGLEDGTKYYFAVTAVDKGGNENTLVASVSVTPTLMPKGTVDPDLYVDVYQSDMVWSGTTLLPDNHNPEKPRIIEVNMSGEIVWEYLVPQNLRQYTNPGFDVELLSNNNILFVLPGKGVYEIDHSGSIVWSYLTPKISHDADRLPNGNTLFVYGFDDQKNDPQAVEVNPKGEVVWTWYAKDYFDEPPYNNVFDQGWSHTNAVSRLLNGNTLISPRNFNMLVEVDPEGKVVSTYGEEILEYQHDPEVLPSGNILIANHVKPHRAIELDPKTGEIVWEYIVRDSTNWPARDANRLPNGNTLITGTKQIVEVTAEGEIVWQLTLKGATFVGLEAAARGFYKAERISIAAP